MSTFSFKKKAGRAKSGHQEVIIIDQVVGEVWREQLRVVVSKINKPIRQGYAWRWFSKVQGDTTILGRSEASLADPGFPSKVEAIDALQAALAASHNLIKDIDMSRAETFVGLTEQKQEALFVRIGNGSWYAIPRNMAESFRSVGAEVRPARTLALNRKYDGQLND